MLTPDREHYNPCEPRSFGKPVDPSELEGSISNFFSRYSTPSAEMRLSHGQDPTIQADLQLMRRDRLLSSFPDAQEGVRFLEKVLPQFIVESLGNQLFFPGLQSPISELVTNKDKFFSQLLFDFFAGKEEIEEGGQETGYINFNKPPKEQSYEYIGEKLTRLIRERVHKDKDPKTRAFFGWIGRHLMKKIYPEADFSLDRHNKMVTEEKEGMREVFKKFRDRVEKGAEGDLTLEKTNAFFKELADLKWSFPGLGSAETPVQDRIASNLSLYFDGFGSISDYLPYYGDEFNRENSFSWFVERWQKKPAKKSDFNYKEHYVKNFPQIFGDLPKGNAARTVSKEKLLPKWFEMLRAILLEGIDRTAKDAQDFNVTYFRFINNQNVAAGYAYAEEHKDEVLANLPNILQLTEEEVQARFMQGEPKILHDIHDLGQNTSDDLYKDTNFEELEQPFTEMKEEAILPPIILTEAEKARTDEDWFDIIGHGPNARIYEELKAYKVFSDEEFLLGVDPLFYGNWLSDQYANMAIAGNLEKFYEQRRNLPPIEAERERIEEFKTGVFSLPKTYKDLIINANRQLIRLQDEFDKVREQVTTFNVDAITQASILQQRMIAIRQVKNTIKQIIAKKKNSKGT